jgi:alpha-tubulin suppressor-like RCC1 family protein
MWTKGEMSGYKFWTKYYDNASVEGISEGRISKLIIKKDGVVLYSFERGLDVDVMDDGAKAVCDYLVTMYN